MRPRPGIGLTAVMVVLTLTTGVMEAVGHLVLEPVLTGMQTGNVLFLAFALVRARPRHRVRPRRPGPAAR